MNPCDETAVIRHYRPRIIRLCKERWPYMHMDEKLSEAEYFMLCAIRTPSVTRFWDTFLKSFIPYMDHHYRDEGKCKFACRSLDANIRTNNHEKGLTLHECLSDSYSFESTLFVTAFIDSLPEQLRNILLEILAGTSHIQIMRKCQLTSGEFKKLQRELQQKYLAWAELPPFTKH